MNKFKTIILAILGGIDALIYISTPIILAILWINLTGLEGWRNYFFYGLGLISALFRGIKIGFIK